MGIAILILAVLIVAAVAGFMAVRARSAREMRASFGPEYDRMLAEQGTRSAADAEARRRRRAHAELELKTLSQEDEQYYAESWDHVRADFVDHPAASLISGDRLVQSLLNDLGYHADPRERMALVSVPHGAELADYREARDIVRQVEEGSEDVSTEQMRVALAAVGRLMDGLLGIRRAPEGAVAGARAA